MGCEGHPKMFKWVGKERGRKCSRGGEAFKWAPHLQSDFVRVAHFSVGLLALLQLLQRFLHLAHLASRAPAGSHEGIARKEKKEKES